FVNVSDQPIQTTIHVDVDRYELEGKTFSITEVHPDRTTAPQPAPPQSRRPLQLPPHAALAWEITAS
ncbi:MAG: hypothetical protein CMJ49_05780, partial [Planctomycetaceae bacterium]|nr:hypothetical protein [Planctomycetaceae bacterium]